MNHGPRPNSSNRFARQPNHTSIIEPFLGKGLGNPDWNQSAPHGSGRVYRRSEVKEHHTVAEFKKEMAGIHSVCINQSTLDVKKKG